MKKQSQFVEGAAVVIGGVGMLEFEIQYAEGIGETRYSTGRLTAEPCDLP
ncbi:hypothetical protein ACFL5F_08185 [Planctomycetota bacterium]